jgi:hypothetical protein
MRATVAQAGCGLPPDVIALRRAKGANNCETVAVQDQVPLNVAVRWLGHAGGHARPLRRDGSRRRISAGRLHAPGGEVG